MRGKYHATRTQVGDLLFASKKEARRYGELVEQVALQTITDLELQPKFLLIPFFDKHRGVNYVADFMYMDPIRKMWVIEDAKGFRTKDYIIKSKLFLYQRSIPVAAKIWRYSLRLSDFDLLPYLDETILDFRFEEV